MKAPGAIGNVAGGSDEFSYFYQLFKEYMDNFIQSVAAIDWADVFSEKGQGFIDLMVAIPEKLQELSAAEVGYYSGYIAFNIAEFFFPVLKIAKLAKAGKLAEGFAEMVADMQKVAQNMANAGRKVGKAVSQAPKKAYDFALDMLDNLLALLRQGTATVKELVQKMFERIRAWLDEVVGKIRTEILIAGSRRLTYVSILGIDAVGKLLSTYYAKRMAQVGIKMVEVGDDSYKLFFNGAEIASGKLNAIKEWLNPYMKLSRKVRKKALDDFSDASRLTKVSQEAIDTLSRMADEAKTWWRNRRPVACSVLEDANGNRIFNFNNKQGLPGSIDPEGLHPLVDSWIKMMRKRSHSGEIPRLPRHHGKCAEVMNISQWLNQIDPSGKMTIIEVRKAFKGFTSHDMQITDFKKGREVIIKHGTYKPACDSCNPLLKYFNIKELI